MILPNTFLIGAQKAATTSFYNWLSQHPEICAPIAVKDYAFFTRDEYYSKGPEHLSEFYTEEYSGEKIVMQGSVHYIYFEEALARIKDFNPEAKFILILRNPVERAISAYEYAVKFNYEYLEIEEAFDKEQVRLTDDDVRVRSELTYKHHGLYFKQILVFLKYFRKEQIKIILFDDVAAQPLRVLKNTFAFLEVDQDFKPEVKSLNTTGRVKNKKLQKIAFGDGKLRNFMVKKVLPFFISEKAKANLRWKVIDMNTETAASDYIKNTSPKLLSELYNFYREDIEQLEAFLDRDLRNWKSEDAR